MRKSPSTTAQLKVNKKSFCENYLDGEIAAGGFEWQFRWSFDNGTLRVEPSLGRALIEDALLRFLIKSDYQLEPGEDYMFTIKARF